MLEIKSTSLYYWASSPPSLLLCWISSHCICVSPSESSKYAQSLPVWQLPEGTVHRLIWAHSFRFQAMHSGTWHDGRELLTFIAPEAKEVINGRTWDNFQRHALSNLFPPTKPHLLVLPPPNNFINCEHFSRATDKGKALWPNRFLQSSTSEYCYLGSQITLWMFLYWSQRDSLTSSFSIWTPFIEFSYLTALIRTCLSVSNRSDKMAITVFFQFQWFLIQDVSCGFCQNW